NSGALELTEQRGERGAPDALPLLQAAEEGAERLGHVARPVEAEPRLEQAGGGLRSLPVDPQPEGVRLRAGAEAEGRSPALRVQHGAELVERQERGLALGPNCLGGPVRTNEDVRQRRQVG